MMWDILNILVSVFKCIDWIRELKPEWIAAFGTIFTGITAVSIAIWGEDIRKLRSRPKLRVEYTNKPPDNHKTFIPDNQGGKLYDCHYVRFRITNVGNGTARNVEVMATSLHKIVEGDKIHVDNFVPLNLAWSYYKKPLMFCIPVGFSKHCDLGYSRKVSSRSVFFLETAVIANVNPNIINEGTYLLEIIVAAENTKAKSAYFKIVSSGEWLDDQFVMMNDHLKISLIEK